MHAQPSQYFYLQDTVNFTDVEASAVERLNTQKAFTAYFLPKRLFLLQLNVESGGRLCVKDDKQEHKHPLKIGQQFSYSGVHFHFF